MKAAELVARFKDVGQLFSALTVLNLVGYQWPKQACVEDGYAFDFVIVGGGTAGCVIAHRLIELGNVTVLLIEAGGNPPFETELPGLVLHLKQTSVDWNFTATLKTNSISSNKNSAYEMTQGKMIGGTGSLNYAAYVRPNKYDFDRWAKLTNDSCWSWESVFPTILKNEKLTDDKILNSPRRCAYGTKGNIKIMKEYFDRNNHYFDAFKELGWNSYLDIDPNKPLGFSNVMFNIGDNLRQSSARDFLSPIKKHPNLYVMTNSLATKIIFDKDRTAVGVEVVKANSEVITVKANIEVIVSAGAIKSPHLLMLSGIGPKDHLKKHGIKLIADLPVGQNFQDHVNSHLVYKLTKAEKGSILDDPHLCPYTVYDGYVAFNKSQKYPDYEPVGLSFGQLEPFLAFCAYYFNFDEEFCDELGKSIATSELLLILHTYLYPKSRGEILLASSNPHDYPIIKPGYYSEHEDVINHANYLQDFNRILETSYFKSINTELVVPELENCKKLEVGSEAYWRCYAPAMSDTAYCYVGTCRIGSVLDSRLRVYGVKKLRVADASSFPDIVGGPIYATVIMLAEKAVELIKEDYFFK